MPATTTARNACGVKIEMDDDTGVLREISGSANEVNLNFEHQLGEYKVFGDRAMYRLECGVDATLEMTVLYTTGASEGYDIMRRWRELGGLRTVRLTLPTSGGETYQGEFLVESIELPMKSDEAKPIMVKASLKPSGIVNWTA